MKTCHWAPHDRGLERLLISDRRLGSLLPCLHDKRQHAEARGCPEGKGQGRIKQGADAIIAPLDFSDGCWQNLRYVGTAWYEEHVLRV